MKKHKIFILTFSFILILCACSSKKLTVPEFYSIKSIEMIYITKENTYSSNESIYSDSSTPSYYEYLTQAKYVKKMNENTMIDSPNIMIVFTLNDQSKVTYTIYQDDNKTYLEDNNHLELYTIDNEVFDTISNNFEINYSKN